ncbi:MAG: hypothetical protein F6J90_30780 [Moorea sp. SIOASIH]|uniref:hypothetical protein n=1 Tax=Moorena sp. SIOASIH TaxID=2607817 RepID=UPI0013B9668A|nr:hypothetical protein [Moorena sp. SIOASIH]NEO40489.1 hypothetical protein [Moorena sp. SIOASIH]NEO93677.1 hypothetical protein [Moorena sp. SIO3G5]
MKRFPDCEEYKDDKKIVLSENRSKLTFLNPKRDKIRIITVDGCAIVDNKTLRCDYALVCSNGVEIYVELKGSKIAHAFKQIESTIKLLSDNPQKIKKLCFVVSTRVPKLTTTIQQLQRKFKKNYNASFCIKTIQDTYNLSKITI